MNLAKIPFTYHWIMKKVVGSPQTLLDLGCGDGNFTADLFRDDHFQITGVEVYPESIKRARLKKTYQKIVKGDIVDLPKSLKSQYDVVLISQAIEHLKKKTGFRAIKQWEKKGSKIIISTPVGFVAITLDMSPVG
jgi:2-polyprenyl-3-methyl-5-hydroxy-6-metoxy-1,4-benzoquinol methylase